jgi:FdhE protein
VTLSPWQRRIQRAQELTRQYPFAAEILGSYIHVARFQEDLYNRMAKVFVQKPSAQLLTHELTQSELQALLSAFGSFLSMAESNGPQGLTDLSRELGARGQNYFSDLLAAAWVAHSPSDAAGYLAWAFLQPYAELVRMKTPVSSRPSQHAPALCPFCHRKPGLGVLRPLGEGSARSLLCSFCLAEWDFRRIVCPACGEEDDKKLAVFNAPDFAHIRVEGCDACKTYIKTADLTKNGRAEPIVDELAFAPLDLWARDHGYAKLQNNLLGM